MELLVFSLDSCCFLVNLVASSEQIRLPSASHRAAHPVLQLHLWILPNLNPVWHGTLVAIGEGERMRHQAGQQWPERHLESGQFPPRPTGGSIAALVLFTICSSTRKRTRRRASCITMAAADSGSKPIQNAMKMAKVAIQLDGGNNHKVGSVALRPQSQHGRFIAE